MRTDLCGAVLGALVLAGCQKGTVSSDGARAASSGLAAHARVAAAPEVVWAGLDYSRVVLVGPSGFTDRDKIMAEFPSAWNDLFLREQLGDLKKALGREVRVDVAGVAAANAAVRQATVVDAEGDKRHYLDSASISPDQIASRVRSYAMAQKSGVGLVFIVERLVKTYEMASLHVVLFDLETRAVLQSRRECHPGRGFGFRSYWFNPVKEAVRGL
jgi:hypothetical protein